MKYENISHLTELLKTELAHIDMLWTTDTERYSLQNGVARTNCIGEYPDVQSALARRATTIALSRFGIATSTDSRPGVLETLDIAFNELFASNGDAISHHYAGTSALKGDFTRTGKRNWRGMLNDARNSVARMYYNNVGDFFKQAVLDYVLGVNPHAFAEFAENVASSDPGKLLQLSSIRLAAIETASAQVLGADETRLDGWTLLSPTEKGQVVSLAYEERVVLLSKQAIHVCSYDYDLQKVRNFERIPLGEVISLQHGVYILSTLSSFARDPHENYGFVLRYRTAGTELRERVYTMRNRSGSMSSRSASLSAAAAAAATPLDATATAQPAQAPGTEAIEHDTASFAFKIMRKDLVQHADAGKPIGSASTAERDCRALVKRLVQALEDIGAAHAGLVTESPIVDLENATRRTSYAQRLTRTMQNLVFL